MYHNNHWTYRVVFVHAQNTDETVFIRLVNISGTVRVNIIYNYLIVLFGCKMKLYKVAIIVNCSY